MEHDEYIAALESLPVEGTRVVLTCDVDRYPHFVAPKGATGTVMEGSDETLYAVLMDDFIAGCEEWDNAVHWYPYNGQDQPWMEIAPLPLTDKEN